MNKNNGNLTGNQLKNNKHSDIISRLLSLSSEQRIAMCQRMTELVERWSESPESLTTEERLRVEGFIRLL
jgi:hypothetical protein